MRLWLLIVASSRRGFRPEGIVGGEFKSRQKEAELEASIEAQETDR